MDYTIFRTQWGYFGLVARGKLLCRTALPNSCREAAEMNLLGGPANDPGRAKFDPDLFGDLQSRIVAYYEGRPQAFDIDPPVDLGDATAFERDVLTACRRVGLGQTTTYVQLAEQIGRPGAARAVGNVMAANPVPLIIPCHRVLRCDGTLGGFSAFGGAGTKQAMLRHEQKMTHVAAPV
jgi:methylated-DNA-[protein]-cysteine S-methyltransferase